VGLGGVDLDATLELRAILDANARGGDVADDGAIGLDVDAIARVDIADYLSVDNNLARVNLGGKLRRGSNRERMSAQRDRPVDFSIDLQIFCAGDMTLDLEAGTEARGAASGTTAERRASAERGGRRIAEGDDRGFCCLGRC